MTHNQFMEALNNIYQTRRNQPEIEEARLQLIEDTIIDMLYQQSPSPIEPKL